MLIKIYSIVYFLTSLCSYRVFGYNCVPDDKDFTKSCDILVTPGYNYQHFFPVEKQPNGEIFLRFYVKAETDAHVLFSQGSSDSGRHYEIIIGAYGNFRSAIRTRKQGENLVPHEESGILSSTKWREFWIRISADGLIQVGKDMNKGTFLSWRDPNIFEINYYSLSCWAPGGVGEFKSQHIANFIHQCSKAQYNKYNTEKFKCSLFSKYDQRIPPSETGQNVIQIEISASYADWDAVNGVFQLIGKAKVSWQDSRLAWEPIEYYKLQSLDLTNDPIWRPEITLTNAAFDNDKPFASGKTTVSHEGVISWTAPFSLQTKCNPTGSSDSQKCPINLTINTFGSQVHISDATQAKVSSPWTVTETQTVNLKKIDNRSSSHSFSIEVPLQRNTANTQSSSGNFSKCVVFSGVDIDKPYLI